MTTPKLLSREELARALRFIRHATGHTAVTEMEGHISALEADNAALVSELARIGGWATGARQRDLEGAIRAVLSTPHTGSARLEEHRKALARARNEGLEMAAQKAVATAKEARARRDAINTLKPSQRINYEIAEASMDTAAMLADDIRALQEPEE